MQPLPVAVLENNEAAEDAVREENEVAEENHDANASSAMPWQDMYDFLQLVSDAQLAESAPQLMNGVTATSNPLTVLMSAETSKAFRSVMKLKTHKGVEQGDGKRAANAEIGTLNGTKLHAIQSVEVLECCAAPLRQESKRVAVEQRKRASNIRDCGFRITERVHIGNAVSWSFTKPENMQHSDACMLHFNVNTRMPKAHEDYIVAMLEMGVPPGKVAERITTIAARQIANGMHPSLMVRTILRASEISAIGRKRNVTGFTRRNEDDMTSAVMLLREKVESGTWSVVYKPFAKTLSALANEAYEQLLPAAFLPALWELDCSDLFLLIVPKHGSAVLARYGSEICIDATHNVCRYDIKLTAVTVVDERANSHVVALLLSKSEREAVYRALFRSLKLLVPAWRLRLVMSDLAPAAHNAALACFGPDIQWLWCMYHFKKAVRDEFIAKVSQPAAMTREEYTSFRRTAYQAIMTLLGSRCDQNGFRRVPADATEVNARIACVRQLLLVGGQFEFLRYFDVYVLGANNCRVTRWSMAGRAEYARKYLGDQVRDVAHSDGTRRVKIPQKLVNNMYSEAFFRIVKHG